MTANEYKQYKGLRKENLRDNMDNIELILTDLSEEATKRIVAKQKPNGLNENIHIFMFLIFIPLSSYKKKVVMDKSLAIFNLS